MKEDRRLETRVAEPIPMSMSYEGGCEGNICLLLLRLGGESSSGSRERDDVERPPSSDGD